MLAPATPRGGRRFPLHVVGVVGLAVVLTAAAVLAPSGSRPRTPARQPAADEIVARVEPGPPAAAVSTTPAPAAPVELAAALTAARRHLVAARRTGDPRHLGRAEAALAPWWDRADAPDDVVLVRATIRQGLHDFAGARADLDALLARRPDDVEARLTRAVVAMVVGDVSTAAADCDRLEALHGPLLAAACAAPLATRGGGARRAYEQLGALVAGAGTGPITAWALVARGELARATGDDAAAERHLRAALAIAPDDSYALGVLADLLLDGGRAAEVERLLRGAEAEPLALRRAIALVRLRDPGAAPLRARLRAELEVARSRGDDTHLRERARYFLDVEPAPEAALAAARGNWQRQREAIDVRLLVEAAAAAGRPLAAAPALAWLRAGAIDDAVLDRAVRGLGVTP